MQKNIIKTKIKPDKKRENNDKKTLQNKTMSMNLKF